MDEITLRTQRAMDLARRLNLQARLSRFEIDDTTIHNLRLFSPVLQSHLERIVIHFYEYLDRFPEARAILKDHDIERLREKQKRHWLQLLSGDFGGSYINGTLMVGLAHFTARVPPHIYIASYSFFLNELHRLCESARPGHDFHAINASISKVIMFDMSISLNAYMLDSFSAQAPVGADDGTGKAQYLPS
jgi:hypothetical protein